MKTDRIVLSLAFLPENRSCITRNLKSPKGSTQPWPTTPKRYVIEKTRRKAVWLASKTRFLRRTHYFHYTAHLFVRAQYLTPCSFVFGWDNFLYITFHRTNLVRSSASVRSFVRSNTPVRSSTSVRSYEHSCSFEHSCPFVRPNFFVRSSILLFVRSSTSCSFV